MIIATTATSIIMATTTTMVLVGTNGSSGGSAIPVGKDLPMSKVVLQETTWAVML